MNSKRSQHRPLRSARAWLARHGRAEGETGATLVEYSLLVALVVVVSLGAIEWTTDSSSDELEDRGGRVGAPDVDAAVLTTLPSVPPPVGGGDDDPATPVPQTVTLSPIAGCQRTSGNEWLASFTFTVTNSAGDPVEGAEISYKFEITRENGTVVDEVPDDPTSSLDGGVVVITKDDLKDSGNPKDQKITLVITGVGGPGPITATALPAPVTAEKKVPPTCS